MSTLLPEWSGVRFPLIGMLHLPALPGAPRGAQSLAEITAYVLRDAEALARGGVHGLMLENFGDTPFFPGRVPAAVVAQMTQIAGAVRRQCELPLGINVLRNDGRSALAIAHAVGAAFIRVNVLTGARVTDQGVIAGQAHKLLRDRVRLGATGIRIWADVDVKHSAALGAPRAIEEEVADLVERGGADAVIVSGSGTGRPTDVEQVRRVKAAAGAHPVLVGSGVTAETVGAFKACADGAIVGTALKVDGVAANAVDAGRVARLVMAVRG
jgi:membrane complex biogenesis BtpA family protein